MLRVSSWIRSLTANRPVEDGFRFLPPALGLEQPSSGPLKLAASLGGGGDGAAQILDNVGQFRFFSAWRGLVERERRST